MVFFPLWEMRMRGDILFYKGDGTFAGALIQWRTRGPYIHVEVDLGDGTAIGAHWQTGVSQHPVDYSRATVYTLPTTPERIETGIQFLQSCVGDPYSVRDILNQALTVFFPHLRLSPDAHAFDCSDLVAHYVELAGGLELGLLGKTPDLVSPNDLARHAGLLPGLR